MDDTHRYALSALICTDDVRLRLLGIVAALGVPDCWIGAGFVRTAVWDHLHGRTAALASDDIDVVWFDRAEAAAERDAGLEERLTKVEPSVKWSVKNQARMHMRNGDDPYLSVENAIARWPETATAVAVRLNNQAIDIIAPHGLGDLFSLIVRPTPAFIGRKLPIFRDRVRAKGWLVRWPHLTVANG